LMENKGKAWTPGPSPSSSTDVLDSHHPKKTNSSSPFVDPVRYKTMICGNFSATGSCPYGELCVYAHGNRSSVT
jgi:hypothetical protein